MPIFTSPTVKHRLIVGLILLLGSAVSVAVWVYIKSTESARIAAEFNRRAEVLAHVARDQIRLHAELVRGVRAYLENSPEVDAAEFDSYCTSLAARLPASTVFQWLPSLGA
jgi:CHASE1-domain containing sensor protein